MKPLRRCSLLTDTLFGPRASASLSRYALQLGLLMCLSACDSLPPLSFSELAVNEALGDLDADGYRVCPSGLSSTEQAQAGCDCDDSSPAIHPHIQELCDSIDNDCSGSPDDGPGYYAQWRDTDGDGWGNPLLERWCDQPLAEYAPLSDDCNDAAKSIHPYAREFCDTIDNDCDAEVDESAEFLPYFRDADNDGYGTSEETVEDCKPPLGFSALSGDCLDDNSAVHPYTLETCENGLDDNCDGYLDCPTDPLEPAQSDPDGDGTGYQTDCDSSDNGVYPGSLELCDEKDNDCDGTVDNASEQTWYLDEDGDGWGSDSIELLLRECDLVGLTTQSGDCDDKDVSVSPSSMEICDGIDNDCDGELPLVEQDKDGDGYRGCEGDCDDESSSIHPSSDELCNGLDDNCDGMIAESVNEIPNNDLDEDCNGRDALIIQVSAGKDHALALDDDGKVWAWGNNSYGQLGDGTYTEQFAPVLVQGVWDVAALAAGGQFSVAAKRDGSVWAWGDNPSLVLGSDTIEYTPIPIQVSGIGDVIALSAGWEHTMALTQDGRVWVWGDNGYGQLGNGDGQHTSMAIPAPVEISNKVQRIAAGDFSSFALDENNALWVWGNNADGQLGIPPSQSQIAGIPKLITSISSVISIASGSNHTVAVTEDGRVWTWGDNGSGQLGTGYFGAGTWSVEPLSGVTKAVLASAGTEFSAVSLEDGTVMAFGRNKNGQLGDGSTVNISSPVEVQEIHNATQLSLGFNFSLALTETQTTLAWGYNPNGQAGRGFSSETPHSPSGVQLPSDIVKVDASYHSSRAITSDGALWSWGENYYANLGTGDYINHSEPVLIAGLDNIIDVSSNGVTTLAAKSDGSVWFFGDGQVTPLQVTGLSSIISVAVGGSHFLALRTNGNVYSWGLNQSGQLGNGTYDADETPTRITTLSNVVEISAGRIHSLARTSDGKVWGWGAAGQSGFDSNGDTLRPTQIALLTTASGISAGDLHSVVMLADGTVYTFGTNSYGQLCRSTAYELPEEVPTLRNAVAISAGDYNTLVLKGDGSVWGCGDNGYAVVSGDVASISGKIYTPIRVSDLVVSVEGAPDQLIKRLSVGSYHAILVEGSGMLSWGNNYYGQLGLGIDTWTPQPVL